MRLTMLVLIGSVLGLAGTPSQAQTCVSDCDCPRGQTCQPAGEGGRSRDSACPDHYDPVCGLNGKTYSNACWAGLDRVGIAHRGACSVEGKTCGGIAAIPCPDGQFCDLEPGQCKVADAAGTCREVPAACPEPYHPVCGCDGNTYGNDCERQMARASLAHSGKCEGATGDGSGQDERACHCCHPTLVSDQGAVIWSGDPDLDSARRAGTGRYRLVWTVDVTDDALFVQPIAPNDDFPRSLLGWPARIGPTEVEVTTDAHYVGSSGTHDHRESLDVRFSLLRCPRVNADQK